MKRRVLLALPLALVGLLLPSTVLAKATSCPHPVPERRYEPESLVLSMRLDLSGCSWWDGSPLELVASLDRFDGQSGHGTTSVVFRGGSEDPRHRVSQPTCEVSVEIEHPTVELARYHGEITYPWRGDERTVSFDATCTSAAEARGCRKDGDRTT